MAKFPSIRLQRAAKGKLHQALKGIVFLTSFLLVALSSPAVVKADNDTLNNDCQITVAGSNLSTSTGNAPTISADEYVGPNPNLDGIYRYSIRVCGDLSLYNPNVGAVAAFGLERNEWNFPTFGRTASAGLTLDGNCLVGTLETAIPYLSNATVDIENTDLSPICRREYGKLAPQTSENTAEWAPSLTATCNSLSIEPAQPVQGTPVRVSFTVNGALFSSNIRDPQGRTWNLRYRLTPEGRAPIESTVNLGGSLVNPTQTFIVENPQASRYVSSLYLQREGEPNNEFCSLRWEVGTPDNPGGPIGGPGSGPGTGGGTYSLCTQIGDEGAKAVCENCSDNDGIWTAFGCIKTNPRSIVTTFMQIGLGLAGGVALIMILAAGFLFSTSQGDIKRTGEAKELLTSAVMGLLFIIFSVVILQFIGVSILQIPGFGGP